MQAAMDEIWVIINTLSFVLYLPILTFHFPEIATVLLQQILGIITFDILETLEEFGFNVLPEMTYTPPFSDDFSERGKLDSGNTLILLASVNIVILVMVTILVLSACSRLRMFDQMAGCRKLRTKFSCRSQVSALNRLILTGFIELMLCCMIPLMKPKDSEVPNLIAMDWNGDLNALDRFSLVYGVLCFVIFYGMIIAYVVIIFYLAPKLHVTTSKKTLEDLDHKIRAYENALTHKLNEQSEKALKDL